MHETNVMIVFTDVNGHMRNLPGAVSVYLSGKSNVTRWGLFCGFFSICYHFILVLVKSW